MPEPRISVLIVAKNEAHNLARLPAGGELGRRAGGGCRPGEPGRDTYEIARSLADVVIVRAV